MLANSTDPVVDKVYCKTNIASNKQKLQKLQDVMSLSSGIAAGALGLESYYGFVFFLLVGLASNLSFLIICCEGAPKKHFIYSTREVMADGILMNFAGYLMMWCLTYALVK